MKASRDVILTGICVSVHALLCYATADYGPEARAPAAWTTPGTEWLVHVRQDARAWGLALGSCDPRQAEEAQIPRVAFDFHMRITVLEPRHDGDEHVLRIRFDPLDGAPNSVRGKFRILELDSTTGKPTAIREKEVAKGGETESVATYDSERVLFTEAHCFPTDWIVNVVDLDKVPDREEERRVAIETRSSLGPTGQFHQFVKKLRQTVAQPDKQKALEVECFSQAPLAEVPYTRVLQTWVPGEGWWRSYTRYIQGHLDLEATLVERKGE